MSGLSTPLQITGTGRRYLGDHANTQSQEISLLSHLEMSGGTSAGSALCYAGLDEKQGRPILNSLLRRKLIRPAVEAEE